MYPVLGLYQLAVNKSAVLRKQWYEKQADDQLEVYTAESGGGSGKFRFLVEGLL